MSQSIYPADLTRGPHVCACVALAAGVRGRKRKGRLELKDGEQGIDPKENL